MFNYSTRSVHSAGNWKFLLGKLIFLISEGKVPLSGLMLGRADLLTLAVFCCCISESQYLELVMVFLTLWEFCFALSELCDFVQSDGDRLFSCCLLNSFQDEFTSRQRFQLI